MNKLEMAITSLKEESWRLSQAAMELSRAQRTWDKIEKLNKAAWDAAALLDAARRRVTKKHEVARVTLRVVLHQRTVTEMVQCAGASEASRRALWAADFALRLAEKVAQDASRSQDDDGPWAA